MLKALYFPYLSLPSAAWTYPNLLFFDRIDVIAPDAGWRQPFDGRTRALQDYGLVGTVDPASYVDRQDDEQALTYILGAAQTKRHNLKYGRIHKGKFAYARLPNELIRLGILEEYDDFEQGNGWLRGPLWVIDYLMSIFAARILIDRDDLSLITNSRTFRGLMVGNRQRPHSDTRRIRAISRLLPVAPGANIADIINFRNSHPKELQDFRRFLRDLIERDREEYDLEARLRDAERLRAHLVNELRNINSGIPPIQIALSLANVAAPFIERSPYSSAAGALGLGYLIYSWAARKQQDRRVMNDKLVYAALADREFSSQYADDILR